jgi:hypothetical protein
MIKIEREELKSMLVSGICQITFTKADGTSRMMVCTLQESALPPAPVLTESKKERKKNPDVVVVWDLEKEAWRSFKFDSITNVSVSG